MNLILCEYKKLKRNRIFKFILFSSILFPIPLSLISFHSNLPLYKLNMFIFIFGIYLLLPIFTGLLFSTAIFEERNSKTLKNIITIPVRKNVLLLSKIFVVLTFGILFSILSFAIPILMEIFKGNIDKNLIFYTLLKASTLGLMVSTSVIPILIILIKMKTNYLLAFIINLFYTAINFVISLQYNSIPLPQSVIFKWSLPYISSGPNKIISSFYSTPSCLGILTITTILSCYISIKIFEREE
ncbi:ABC transporter permease [Apilactobacillus xinyiensis]|uniref:ABC transporter permease n=1 Tax=Apilactobacillus xinyiensis TaxID=2841032 RepID=UPI00200D3069|nr:ABC transporter permease [Apilactobacillus xinyiensis]MCL0330810.1 ABC transporter permease [Apilactobacillus xinyiensis]